MDSCSTKPDQDIAIYSDARIWNAPLSDSPKGTRIARLLSYGDLIAPGEYSVHSRFRRASNFLCGTNLVSIVDRTIGCGPLNIVMDGYESVVAERFVIRPDSIQIDDIQFVRDVTLWYDSTIEIPPTIDPQKIQANLCSLKEIVKELAPSKSLSFLLDELKQSSLVNFFENVLRERLLKGTRMIADGEIVQGVSIIKGLGFGLTPSGDDFIAGLLMTLNLQQIIFKQDMKILIDDIFTAAMNSNPLSMAFLRSAKEGRAFEKLKRMIASLFGSDPDDLVKRTADLLTVGATSGADIAVGLIIGLEGGLRTHGH
jgi:hypothetical protein